VTADRTRSGRAHGATGRVGSAIATVARGLGMVLVIFVAYGGWVVVPLAVIAALFAAARC
jgi:hypothetical protein